MGNSKNIGQGLEIQILSTNHDDRIRSIGFIITDKNQTPFSLKVDWIKS